MKMTVLWTNLLTTADLSVVMTWVNNLLLFLWEVTISVLTAQLLILWHLLLYRVPSKKQMIPISTTDLSNKYLSNSLKLMPNNNLSLTDKTHLTLTSLTLAWVISPREVMVAKCSNNLTPSLMTFTTSLIDFLMNKSKKINTCKVKLELDLLTHTQSLKVRLNSWLTCFTIWWTLSARPKTTLKSKN